MNIEPDAIVVCNPVRTPVGRFDGALAHLSAAELAACILTGLAERTSLDPAAVDDVILGHCYPGVAAPAIGRVALLDAGWPESVPGCQVDRRCGSGLQAVLDAAGRIATGAARVVVAGGVESMSNVGRSDLDAGRRNAGGAMHPVPGGMIETAENLRRGYAISRADQDTYALRSQQAYAHAAAAGRFTAELLPVATESGLVEHDEHPRPDTTATALAGLTPVLAASDPDATVTAGNASGQNDGAAVAVVTTAATAAGLGLDPMLRLVSWAVAGTAPETMGIGPVPATAAALRRAGLELADLDLIELNEAFAAQVLAVLTEWRIEPNDPRLNVNGSGISLGHPVGATGARILATLAHEGRRRNAGHVLEAMCIGGGQGLAAVFECVGLR